MYLNYKNSKITIADYDPACPVTGMDPKEFLAQSVSLQLSATVSPSYLTEKRYSQTFAPEDGINGTLNLSYSLTGVDPLKDYIINDSGNASKYRTLSGNFGGLNFSSGYLTNYDVGFSPNQPITATASIKFFGALSGVYSETSRANIVSSENTPTLNVQDVTMSSDVEDHEEIKHRVDNIRSFTYTYAGVVEPSYQIGDILPDHVVFGPKVVQASLEVDSLSGDLPIYGKSVDLTATLLHPELPGVSETFPVSGVISSRNINTSVGNIISTNLSVQQTFLGQCPTVTNTVGAHAWGSTYTVTGTNFIDVTQVKIGQVNVQDYSVTSKTTIQITIPQAATSNKVTVFTEGCDHGVSSSSNTSVTDPGIKVTGYYESNGNKESYVGRYLDKITVKGQYFNAVDEVFFVKNSGPQGSESLTRMNADFEIMAVGSTSELKATVPDGCISGHLLLKSSLRSATSTNDAHLNGRLFVPFPVIDSVSFSNNSRPNGFITLSAKGFSCMTPYLSGGTVQSTGGVNNLPLAPLSGATSSGFQVLTESGERLGDRTMIISAPKLSAGYAGGVIRISGASGVTTTAPINYEPTVYISGIKGNLSSSDLALGNQVASGEIGEDIRISGGNFYSNLLYDVTAHHGTPSSSAYSLDFNGATGIFYPDATNPYTVLTGVVPPNAKSGLLSILNPQGESHPSGMDFSAVLPDPIIKSVTPHSGMAGGRVTLSGHYFDQTTAVKLIKRSTSKAGDEMISGKLLSSKGTNNSPDSTIGLVHGGVSGFSTTLNIARGSDGVNADLIQFDIPSGWAGGASSSSTAGTAGTSFENLTGQNFLFTGHGIFDVVLESDRGLYTCSGASTSGLLVMGEPKPSGVYVQIDTEITPQDSLSGTISNEIYISGENLYPNSLVYINDYLSERARGIPTISYAAGGYNAGTAGEAGTAGTASTLTHMLSGQYTGLSFFLPALTGTSRLPLNDTGVKFYVDNGKSISEIKGFGSKVHPNKSITDGDNDIFAFLRPTISGFSIADKSNSSTQKNAATAGDTVTVSGAFLTGINYVRLGNTRITSGNYLKTKNSPLLGNWKYVNHGHSAIEKSIYGTQFSFQVPTGSLGGAILVQATGGHVKSDQDLGMLPPVPEIDGFTKEQVLVEKFTYLEIT